MIDLTADFPWLYRAVAVAGPGPWRRTVASAVRGLVRPLEPAPWPQRWNVFEAGDPAVADPPSRIGRGRAEVVADLQGMIDIAAVLGAARPGRTAWLVAERCSDAHEELTLHLGADWWMRAFIDGAPILDTWDQGNRGPLREGAHEASVRLAAGRHLIAVQVRSGAGGWAFAGAATRQRTEPVPPLHIEACRRVAGGNGRGWAGLVFIGDTEGVRLAGRPIPLPLAGMRYRRIDGLPPECMGSGGAELTRSWDADASRAGASLVGLPVFRGSGGRRLLRADGRLLAVPRNQVALRTGPVVSAVDAGTVGIACRTNAVASVELRVGRLRYRSPAGLVHRFVLDGLRPGTCRYAVRPEGAAWTGTHAFRLPSTSETRIAVYGDPSPRPAVLRRVLRAMERWRPDMAVALGDLTAHGRRDEAWDAEFFGLAPRWFARTPHLWVPGNHDESSPLFARLACAPGSARRPHSRLRWSYAIGNLRLIGVDGLEDWSAGSANLAWLERRLAAARETYVVFAAHYPAWTSTPHGALAPDGRPVERPVREAREALLPLLARHRVSLFLNGHAHCYERSHPPGGVPCITSGGAGGYLYAAASDLNPHSAVMKPVHHWCRLTVSRRGGLIEAVGLDGGRVIDAFELPRRT